MSKRRTYVLWVSNVEYILVIYTIKETTEWEKTFFVVVNKYNEYEFMFIHIYTHIYSIKIFNATWSTDISW